MIKCDPYLHFTVNTRFFLHTLENENKWCYVNKPGYLIIKLAEKNRKTKMILKLFLLFRFFLQYTWMYIYL